VGQLLLTGDYMISFYNKDDKIID